MLLTFKCPSRQCQSSTGLPPTRERMKLATFVLYTSVKVIWYKFSSSWAIAITSPFAPPTMHSFMWNCILNPFDKSLLTKSKLACKLGMWSTFMMQIVFFFAFRFNSNSNKPHSDGFGHAIITQANVAWRNYLVGVECRLMRSHMICGSRIHPFANIPWMCSVLHYKCESSLSFTFLAFSILIYLFIYFTL